ncbi:hypothetical protein K438DRAFT_1790265 [Mycena galopus ATCC 62051]|nr:hypothetical protein K438DRAFT_1790265 [Mycena galopus ATCC 62051]
MLAHPHAKSSMIRVGKDAPVKISGKRRDKQAAGLKSPNRVFNHVMVELNSVQSRAVKKFCKHGLKPGSQACKKSEPDLSPSQARGRVGLGSGFKAVTAAWAWSAVINLPGKYYLFNSDQSTQESGHSEHGGCLDLAATNAAQAKVRFTHCGIQNHNYLRLAIVFHGHIIRWNAGAAAAAAFAAQSLDEM